MPLAAIDQECVAAAADFLQRQSCVPVVSIASSLAAPDLLADDRQPLPVPSLSNAGRDAAIERVDLRDHVAQLIVGVDRDRRSRRAVDNLLRRAADVLSSTDVPSSRRSLADRAVANFGDLDLPVPPAVSTSSMPSPRSLIRASTPTSVSALMRSMTSPTSLLRRQSWFRSTAPTYAVRIGDFEVADVDADRRR